MSDITIFEPFLLQALAVQARLGNLLARLKQAIQFVPDQVNKALTTAVGGLAKKLKGGQIALSTPANSDRFFP